MASFVRSALTGFRATTPSLGRIESLLNLDPARYCPDHIAFRTFSSRGGIDSIAQNLTTTDYIEKDSYQFPTKHLNARWFAPITPGLPRVFISQLEDHSLSVASQMIITKSSSISFSDYEQLRSESEYGAWTLMNGSVVNHTTISIDDLININSLKELHVILKMNGFTLLNVGGEIKVSNDGLLKQSSIISDTKPYIFSDQTTRLLSGGFVEFIHRYRDGFEAGNAVHIFESTTTHSKD